MVYGFKDDPEESVCEVSDDDSDGDVSEYHFFLRGMYQVWLNFYGPFTV